MDVDSPKASEAQPPPSYATATENETPPAYTPPSSYRIGGQQLTAPLVSVEQLKAHLSLLRAFKRLRTVIDEGKDGRLSDFARSMDPLPRWAWFVGLAVERFQLWLPVVAKAPMDSWMANVMPPLDVLMVWHAYLLNPFWYAEDTTRLPLLNNLRNANNYLLQSIVHVRDISTYEASPERQTSWMQQTGTPYDPLDAAAEMLYHQIECPKCFMTVSVPFLTPEGTGYSQHQFTAGCPSCKFSITKENLAVLKYARDIVLDNDSVDDVEKYGKAVFLPGTLRSPTNASDERVAGIIKRVMKGVFGLKDTPKLPNRRDWLEQVLTRTDYAMLKVRAATNMACGSRGRRAVKILSAYTDDRPFSTDLVGAVIRQGSFVDKMHDFGWTEPGYFDDKEDEAVLVHSIARYHAFLDLMSSTPTSFFVPTLDIDLAWHTHQMMAITYNNDCGKYIKRYIDHDDKVEENYLANHFDLTCRAWEQRFKIPYTYCGCPLPGDTIGQRLSRLTRRLSSAAPSSSPDGLIPPHRPDALSATHASEHNCVQMSVHNGTTEAQKRRQEKIRKRRERDEKQVREGKMDEDTLRRGQAHDVAFLYPVPFFLYTPIAACIAVGPGAVGCAGGSVCRALVRAAAEDAAEVEDAEADAAEEAQQDAEVEGGVEEEADAVVVAAAVVDAVEAREFYPDKPFSCFIFLVSSVLLMLTCNLYFARVLVSQ